MKNKSPKPTKSEIKSANKDDSAKKSESLTQKKRRRSYSGIDLNPKSESDEEKNTKTDDFKTYKFSPSLIYSLQRKGINTLFEVQKKVYNHIYNSENVIVSSLTGSGKTLAFLLPLIMKARNNNLINNSKPFIIIITPTRELSIQINNELIDMNYEDEKKSDKTYKSFKSVLIYGGVSMEDQIYKLKSGVDIIVGTPGRIIDMIERGNLITDDISTVVLDEADKMLSMGFEEQIEDIFTHIRKNKNHKAKIQVCLFSATIEKWVRSVVSKLCEDKEKIVEIDLVKNLENKTPKTVKHLIINCIKSEKTTTIADLILTYGGKNKSTIIFVNTKKECNDLMISEKVKQEVQIIHGDINQSQREATLNAFKSGKIKCLVATDVASRGLDIPDVDLVIQSEPPKDVDTYIHRAGRTARAGKSGICITLYTRYTECLLDKIKSRAKIKFQKINPPQRNDIITASVRDIETNLIKIDESSMGLFNEASKRLLTNFGPENLTCRLLAMLSGFTDKVKNRSLLCGAEGFVTYTMKFNKTFNHIGYVWGFFKRLLKDDLRSGIRGMRAFASMDGCVFDYPEDKHEMFEEILFNDRFYMKNFTLEKTEEIPDLEGNDNNNNNNVMIRSTSTPNVRRHGPKFDLFVANLSYKTTEDELKTWLNKNGLQGIDFDCRIVTDKDTGNSRGFGFISVYDKKDIETAVKLNGKEMYHRKIIINESKK